MGWPTNGTGMNYNLNTGFGCYIGGYTKKVMMSHIFCMRCRVCEVAKSRGVAVKIYNCIQNWDSDGPSKNMEAAAILVMIIKCVKQRLFVMKAICSDDDNVMSTHLKYKRSNNKKDK